MTQEVTLLSAFLVGLLGSGHCIGMCGGIVGLLGSQSGTRPMRQNLLYNLGRMSSYTLAGGIAGTIGYFTLRFVAPEHIRSIGGLLSGIFMCLLGLYIAGLPQLLLPLEKAGKHLWRRLEPLNRRLFPIQSASSAYMLGLLWGWLPCGMVYSVLSWALVSADPLTGASLMLAFAVGTLPTLLLMGVFAETLNRWAKNHIVRLIAGIMIMLFGLWMLLAPSAHQHQHHQSTDNRSEPAATQSEHHHHNH